MPPGYPPFLHCHLFFYFFSIFCIQYISVSLPATYTHSRQHIPFGFCLLPELYAFIIFSFEVFSFFRKSPHFLPASAGRHLTRSILTNSQARTSHAGFAGHTPPVTFLSKHSQPFTSHHTFFRRQPAISYPQHSYQFSSQNLARRLCRPALLQSPTLPQTPSAIFRCLRATSFPLHFAAAFHSSNIPFFLFFLSSTLFLFLFFFLSSFPFFFFFLLFIIFSLHFLFSRLFLSSFLFSFLLYVFLSNLFFLPFFSFSFFYHITLHVFLCAPSQRLQNRTQFCKPVQGHLPLAGFRGGAPYSFLFFLYV